MAMAMMNENFPSRYLWHYVRSNPLCHCYDICLVVYVSYFARSQGDNTACLFFCISNLPVFCLMNILFVIFIIWIFGQISLMFVLFYFDYLFGKLLYKVDRPKRVNRDLSNASIFNMYYFIFPMSTGKRSACAVSHKQFFSRPLPSDDRSILPKN